MRSRAETTSWLTGGFWTVALATLPAAVIFLDHRWTDVMFMFLTPTWPLQMAVAAVVAVVIARVVLSGGAALVAVAVVASQLVLHRHGEHADAGAFLVAAFQVALTVCVVGGLRDGWRGEPSAAWRLEPDRGQVVAYGATAVLALLAWASGLAGWTLGLLGDEESALLVVVVAGAVSGRAAILLHELGHALVARRRLRTDVALRVGRRGTSLTVSAGGVEARLHLLDVAGDGGAVEADAAEATADDVVAIALAGPVASLLGFVAALPLLASFAAPEGFLHALVWTFALANLVGVLNLLPLRVRLERGGPAVATDGHQVMEALAAKWTVR